MRSANVYFHRFHPGWDYPLVRDHIAANAEYQQEQQQDTTPTESLLVDFAYRVVIYPMTGVRCVCANCGNEFLNVHTAHVPHRAQCSPCTNVLDDYWYMDNWDEFDLGAALEADAENMDYFEAE